MARQLKEANKGKNGSFKSSSDTAVYAPALADLSETPRVSPVQARRKMISPDYVNKCLTKLRIGTKPTSTTSREDETDMVSSDDEQSSYEEARHEMAERDRRRQAKSVVDKAILEAEKFKAAVDKPRGMNSIRDNPYYDQGVDDEEFLQVVSHIEDTIVSKVERGEFIELTKLLLRMRYKNKDRQRVEVVQQDGTKFLAPVDDEADLKINNVRRWEQAFRVYAAIYTRANPERSVEIWQYIENINRAASTYLWENVAAYDYQFRQLMAKNPRRPWSKTCHELWNLTLLAPLSGKTSIHGMHGNNNGANNGAQQSKRKETVCWKFNRGSCPFGSNCRFPHKCSYCFSRGHGANTCSKKQGKREGAQNTGNLVPVTNKERKDKERKDN